MRSPDPCGLCKLVMMVLGRVQKNGVVVLEDGSNDLKEGALVEVVPVSEDEESFELTPEEEAELAKRIAAVNRGETISHEEFLARRRARREARERG